MPSAFAVLLAAFSFAVRVQFQVSRPSNNALPVCIARTLSLTITGLCSNYSSIGQCAQHHPLWSLLHIAFQRCATTKFCHRLVSGLRQYSESWSSAWGFLQVKRKKEFCNCRTKALFIFSRNKSDPIHTSSFIVRTGSRFWFNSNSCNKNKHMKNIIKLKIIHIHMCAMTTVKFGLNSTNLV